MKTIATILLVLVATIGMAAPVLGAESGSSAGASSDGIIAQQFSDSWASTCCDDEYAEAGSSGAAIIGGTGSSSGAAANEFSESADAGTTGGSAGLLAGTESHANAAENDPSGVATTTSDSYANGFFVQTGGNANSQNVALPFTAHSDANGLVVFGYTVSGGTAHAGP